MHTVFVIAGIVSILSILLDASVRGLAAPGAAQIFFALTSSFYHCSWIPYRTITGRIPSRARRENFLGYSDRCRSFSF